jgi:GT2 family glycosyltransferase
MVAAEGAPRLERAAKIALCICTRNRPQELRRALISIRGSSLQPSEILVSDDSDREHETAAVCVDFPGVSYLQGPRRGLSSNRNNCLAHLPPEVDTVMFMDDDVVLPPRFLATLAQRIRDAPPNAIVTGFEYRDGFKVTPHNCSFWGHQEKPPASEADVHAICINATAFPRSLFDSLRFDDLLRYGSEEIDICARAEQAGFRVVFDPTLFVHHRRSPVNRDEYSHFQDASRLYTTYKRYRWIEGKRGKTLMYSVLAPLHLLVSVATKRRSVKDLRLALTAIATAVRYARTNRLSRFADLPEGPGPRASAGEPDAVAGAPGGKERRR